MVTRHALRVTIALSIRGVCLTIHARQERTEIFQEGRVYETASRVTLVKFL